MRVFALWIVSTLITWAILVLVYHPEFVGVTQ